MPHLSPSPFVARPTRPAARAPPAGADAISRAGSWFTGAADDDSDSDSEEDSDGDEDSDGAGDSDDGDDGDDMAY